MPTSHLMPGGDFGGTTENCQNFLDPRGAVPMDVNHDDEYTNEKQKNKEEDMQLLVTKLEDLKGPPMEVPEYKDSYKVIKIFL